MEHKKTGCQTSSEAPTLCTNNCGFFGSVETLNMCSKCHKNFILNEEQAKLALSSARINGSSYGTENKPVTSVSVNSVASFLSSELASSTPALDKDIGDKGVKQIPNRCSTCRKRVGLTGFNCRCGNLFCAIHRYSEKHNCSYDYQTAARAVIAKANPLFKAEKLDKI